MAELAISAVGAFVGSALLPAGLTILGTAVSGAALGWTAGALIGSALFPAKLPTQHGPRLSDLKVQSSAYGAGIPVVYGAMRLAGNVIWSADIRERKKKKKSGGKGGPTQTVVTYTYSCSFAVGLCEGPIAGVRRIWADGVLIYDLGASASAETIAASTMAVDGIRIYTGDESQLPDPTMEAHLGVGNVPAHRGLAYVVFTDFQLAKFGNRVPNITCEIVVDGATIDFNVFGGLALNGQSCRYDDGIIRVQSVPWTTGDPEITRTLSSYSLDGALISSRDEKIPAVDSYPHLYIIPCANDDRVVIQVSETSAFLYASDYSNDSHELHIPSGVSGANPVAVAVGANPLPMPYRYGDYIYVCGKSDSSSWVSRYGIFGGYPDAYWVVPDGAADCRVSVSDDGSIYAIAETTSSVLYKLSDDLVLLSTWESPFPGGFTGPPFYVIGDYLIGSDDDGDTSSSVFDLTDDPPTLVTTIGGGFGCLPAGPNLVAMIEAGTYNSDGDPGIISQIVSIAALLDPSSTTIGEIVGSLCEHAGLQVGEYDVSDLTDSITGYAIAQPTSARAAIEPLAAAFGFDAVESGDVMRFVPRGGATVATLDADDLSAHAYGESQPPVLITTRADEGDLPRTVRVHYIDPATDYQPGVQEARRLQTSSRVETSVELAVAMSADQARAAAVAILYRAWQGRQSYRLSVARDHTALEPTDPITAVDLRMRLTSVARGANGVIQIEAEAEDTGTIYGLTLPADSGTQPAQTVGLPGPTALAVLDLPALRDQDDNGGVYLAACGYLSGWEGTVVYRSSDSGETWAEIDALLDAGTLGTATTALADGQATVWDFANTVTVQLLSGTLDSASESAVLNGANAAALGYHGRWEIIQWQTATLVDTRTYTLSGLLRGRRGTEWATGLHAIGDAFVLLDAADLTRSLLGSADYGVSRLWRGASVGLDTLSGDIIDIAAAPESLLPYAPVHVVTDRTVSEIGAHRYWRVYFTAGVSAYTTVSEAQLREYLGGADLTGSGTASADSTYTGAYPASNAFDDDTSTQWTSAATYPHWLKYDFGSGNDTAVTEYTLRAKTEHVDDMPTAWQLEYSDDGSTWTVADSRADEVFAPAETKTFSFGGVEVSWVRRARINSEWRDSVDVPLDEPVEQYRVRLLDVDTGDPIAGAEWTVTGSTTYSISTASVIAAYGVPDATVRVEVAQISAAVGAGHTSEVIA